MNSLLTIHLAFLIIRILLIFTHIILKPTLCFQSLLCILILLLEYFRILLILSWSVLLYLIYSNCFILFALIQNIRYTLARIAAKPICDILKVLRVNRDFVFVVTVEMTSLDSFLLGAFEEKTFWKFIWQNVVWSLHKYIFVHLGRILNICFCFLNNLISFVW